MGTILSHAVAAVLGAATMFILVALNIVRIGGKKP